MKKLFALLLAVCIVMSFAACGPTEKNPTEPQVTDPTDPAVDVMSYAEFVAAEIEAPVTIEATIQAAQKWNAEYSNTTLYTQDEDGAYFIYRLACTEDEYAALTVGTKIRVTGYKAEWSGEVEIIDATYEILEDGNAYVADAVDVTDLLGTETLADHMNQKVSFTGMTVAPSTDANGNEVAFLYNWDGSGSKDANSDLYFNVSVNGQVYNFCVESDLCSNTTDVYATVEALNVGDTVDMEGFLYWYEGAQPHITSVTVK